MPCAVRRLRTTCSRPRRPSAAPARSPGCSTRPSPTSCSPRGTSPATKAPCSTCSSAKPSTPAGRTATCANTRPSTPPPRGRLDQLLEDPLYLLAVDPARLVPHLDAARSAPARATAAVYRQSAHLLAGLDRPMRASQLELTAHHLGYRGLAARIASAAPGRPWQTRWSHGRGPRTTRCSPATGPVDAVAVGTLPDGTPVIISGGTDGTVRVWRMADGTPLGEPLTGHDGSVTAVAAGSAAGRHPGHHQRRHRRHGAGMAAGRRHPRRRAAAGDDGPGGRGGGRRAAGRHPGHHQRRLTARCGCGGWPGTARRARPATATRRRGGGRDAAGRHLGHHQRRHATARCGYGGWPTAARSASRWPATPAAVSSVAVGALPDGTPVIVSGGAERHGAGVADGRRHPARRAAGRPRRQRAAAAVGRCRTALRSSSAPAATARCGCGGWPTAPRSASRRRRRRHGAGGGGRALPDGTPVIISGGWDGMVRVWRLADGTAAGEPLDGHNSWVDAVAVGTLPDGTPVIISGGGRRHGAGMAAGRRHPGRGAAYRPRRLGDLGRGRAAADGTSVIVSGGG